MGGFQAARRGHLIALLIVVATAAVALPSESTRRTLPLLSELPNSPSSALFPIYGDVYPLGSYYVAMNIGNPPKPYFLDIDTGSDLTWIECDAPCVRCSKGPHPLYVPRSKNLLPCRDPLCAALQSISSAAHDQNCGQCDYDIQYEDRGSSLGVLVSDAFVLRLTNRTIARPTLAFGCGYDQEYASNNVPAATDGVLGLGTGKVSVLSQLSDQGMTKNVVGHCLSSKGGGYLFFGVDFVPSSRMTWVPMSRIASRNAYSPGQAYLYWGTQFLGVKHMKVVFDTGSTYSYFNSQAYQAFQSVVKKDLSNTPLKEFPDPALRLCWKGPKPFNSVTDVMSYFKPLALGFDHDNGAHLLIPPKNYLIITKHGNACLGILDGTKVGLDDLNVVGDISMQDHLVVYDNEKQQIGWVHAACEFPKSGTSSP